jgi:putative SOS response-associated peptidase YedK
VDALPLLSNFLKSKFVTIFNRIFRFGRRFNIAPSQEVPVIIQNGGKNELKIMRWGLVPSWAPDRSIANRLINARPETITNKPSFWDWSSASAV